MYFRHHHHHHPYHNQSDRILRGIVKIRVCNKEQCIND